MIRASTTHGKALAMLAAFLLYIVAFIILFPRIGAGVSALAMLFVFIGGWSFGMAGGIATAILFILTNAWLLTYVGHAGWEIMLRGGGSAGSLTLLLVGAGAGYLRRLHERNEQEILARKRAEQVMQRRDRLREALAYCAEQLLRNPSWQDALEQVLARLGEATGACSARVLQNAQDSQAQMGVDFRAVWTAEGVPRLPESAWRFTDGETEEMFQEIARRLAQGEIVFRQREAFPGPVQERLAAQGVQTSVMIPVFVGGDWWGQLAFDDCDGTFADGPMERDVFAIAAGLVGAAVQRQQAEATLRKRNRELQLLNRLVTAAAGQKGPQPVLEIACRELAQVFDLAQAGAALLDETSGSLEVVAQFTRRKGGSGVGSRIPIAGNPATQIVIQQKKPLIIADAQHDRRMAPVHDLMRENGVVTIMILPLIVNGEVVGTLGLDAAQRRDFTEDEVQLAMTAAAAVGSVLERARLLEETMMQARQMRQVADAVPVGLLLLDEDRRVVVANAQARDYLQQGGVRDERGRLERFGHAPMGTLLQPPPGDQPFHEVRIGEGATGADEETVFEVLAADIDGDGWALVLHDVTTARDQARRLQAQERLAVVGQLSAGIAHDFNNILGVMVLYMEMLRREPLSAEARTRVDIVHGQAQRATRLVEQILDFSRKAVLRREQLDLAPFVKQQAQALAELLPDDVEVQVACEAGRYMVEADPGRLQQVLRNLALNARDAMLEGGCLRLTLSRLAPDADPPPPDMPAGEWIRLVVGDDGEGIAPENLPHIFEPFFTTKAPGGGSGLGLAQAYGIIKQHQGYVDVESAPGEGTTFHIYLPAI